MQSTIYKAIAILIIKKVYHEITPEESLRLKAWSATSPSRQRFVDCFDSIDMLISGAATYAPVEEYHPDVEKKAMSWEANWYLPESGEGMPPSLD